MRVEKAGDVRFLVAIVQKEGCISEKLKGLMVYSFVCVFELSFDAVLLKRFFLSGINWLAEQVFYLIFYSKFAELGFL